MGEAFGIKAPEKKVMLSTILNLIYMLCLCVETFGTICLHYYC